MVLAAAVAGCVGGVDPVEADAPGTQQPATQDGADAESETATPNASNESADDPESPSPPDPSSAVIAEMEAGEGVEDQLGNLIAVYDVAVWPGALEAADPFARDDFDLAGGIEERLGSPTEALVALDVGMCAGSQDSAERVGVVEFSIVADRADSTDRATSTTIAAHHPIVEPAFVFPVSGECSRGWIVVAGADTQPPTMARYRLTVASGQSSQSDDENSAVDYTYLWSLGEPVAAPADGGFAAGEVVSFNDGSLAGTTVSFGGWSELVGSDSPIAGTRLVGVIAEVCPAGSEWPEFGLAIEGWNLAPPLETDVRLGTDPDALAEGECHEGWVRFAVPLAALPTGFFATDGVDPVAGFARWSLAGAAVAAPR